MGTALNFMKHLTEESDVEAHALRRYVSARAHGRAHPEFYRYDEAIGCWVASDETEVAGLCGEERYCQVRRPGLAWCTWLGQDIIIAADHALQAYFELQATDAHDWHRLLKEVSRNRRAALRDWRRRGREVIASLNPQAALGPVVRPPPASLATEFRQPGRGMRSLKKA